MKSPLSNVHEVKFHVWCAKVNTVLRTNYISRLMEGFDFLTRFKLPKTSGQICCCEESEVWYIVG